MSLSAQKGKSMKRTSLAILALLSAMPSLAANAAAAPAPAEPSIPSGHNLEGVWKLQSSTGFGPKAERDGVTFVAYPYKPEFQAAYDKHILDESQGHPVQTAGADCLPSGLGRMMTGGGPSVEILQNQREVVVYKENGGLHRI